MTNLKITLAQISEQNNLDKIEKIVAKHMNSHLVIFPEDTLKTDELSVIHKLKDIAKKYDSELIIGVVYTYKGKTYDFTYYISKDKIERYQKIHVHWKEKHVPGKKYKLINTKYGKIGLLMCYDVAYIKSSLILRKMGADFIVVISSIPYFFKNEYFNLRLRAIAYFNQVFVIHCCIPGKRYSGHSSIVGPRGRILKELGKYEKVASKTINTKLVEEWRNKEKIILDEI